MAFSQHLAQEVDSLADAAGIDKTLGEMAIGDGGRAEGGIGDDVAIDLEGDIDTALVAVGVDEVVVRNNVGDNIGLVEEEVEESDGLVVPLGAVHGGDDGVAGEDGGAGDGEH